MPTGVVFAIAIGQIGVSSGGARTDQEVVTAARGVAQSTVTGTGNLDPVTDEAVNFATSGILTHIYVKTGEYVHKGQLLATLDRTSARLTLRQAEATLTSAKATLVSAEETDTTTTNAAEEVDFVSDGATTPATTTATTTTTPATTATTTSAAPTTTTTAASPTTATSTTESSPSASASSGGSSTTTTSSAATIDSDEVTVATDEEAVKTAEAGLAETRLRAPVAGTIASLEGLAPGDAVSSGSDSSTSASDTSSSGSSGTSTTSSSSGSSASSDSSTSSSTSTTDFAEIVSLHKLSMTVAFDESDISKIKVGQAATVTLDALTGVELGAKVTAVSSLGTTSSSVVSSDATLTLDQSDARIKPGMSASAAVIVGQGQGVTVPNAAVTGTSSLGTVTELVDGKSVAKQVIVGERGDSRTVIVSGLKAGTQLVVKTTLPSESSSSAASTSASSSSSGTLGASSAGTGAAGGFTGGGTGAPGSGGPP